nr:MAG TPA_asm: hypothetical protein [Caudoviricetes sp.]
MFIKKLFITYIKFSIFIYNVISYICSFSRT